jgi:hypothetical protein
VRSRPSASRPASTSRIASSFKQLFQAQAIDVCQIDACRIGGVNEAIAVLLLGGEVRHPGVSAAGGVGLCEYVQHLAFFDYIAVSGSLDDRVVEWVDHLHEHFRHPAVVRHGRYVRPDCSRLQHRDAAVVARRLRVSGRARLVAGRGRGGRRMTMSAAKRQSRQARLFTLDRYRLLQVRLLTLRAGPR